MPPASLSKGTDFCVEWPKSSLTWHGWEGWMGPHLAVLPPVALGSS